jgi:hypothetical protein
VLWLDLLQKRRWRKSASVAFLVAKVGRSFSCSEKQVPQCFEACSYETENSLHILDEKVTRVDNRVEEVIFSNRRYCAI